MSKAPPLATAALLYLSAAVVLGLPTTSLARGTAWPGETMEGRDCTEFAYEHGYGPYDYTNSQARRNKLPVVEKYHFTEKCDLFVVE
jgi:hypothetical protein